MTIEEGKLNDFSRGVANTLPSNRTPEGFVRDALNLDPHGATLAKRSGYRRLVDSTTVRAVMTLGNHVLFADGGELKRLDLNNDAVEVLANIASTGPVASATVNKELFIQTRGDSLRYDGRTVREWGVPDVRKQPEVSVSDAGEDSRFIAMTWVNEYGEEGGTVRGKEVDDGTYSVTIPAAPAPNLTARVYVSPRSGTTMYWQQDASPGDTIEIDKPRDDTAPLQTVGLTRPPLGTLLEGKDAVICIAKDNVVYFTEPFKPHLHQPLTAFVQYPESVNMLLDGARALYVGADECYALRGVEGLSVEQETVLDYPPVPGTGVITTGGRAAWMTEYGLAIEGEQGGIDEPNKETFSPRPAEEGTMGYIEAGGRQMAVATMRGRKGASGRLSAGDYFEAEVVKK